MKHAKERQGYRQKMTKWELLPFDKALPPTMTRSYYGIRGKNNALVW